MLVSARLREMCASECETERGVLVSARLREVC